MQLYCPLPQNLLWLKFTAENPCRVEFQLFFFLALNSVKTVESRELIKKCGNNEERRQNKRANLSSTEWRGRRALKVDSWKTNKLCDLILRGSRRNVLRFVVFRGVNG